MRRAATWGAAAAASAAVAHLAPAVSAWRQARYHLAPRLTGRGRPDHVALTFDDGPDPASTPAVLDTLDRLGWRATFFLLGSQVATAGGLTAELVARGHEVGVHGDSHVSHLARPWWWVTDDLRRACDRIADAGGGAPRWFRPPYGIYGASSAVGARAAGLQAVLWTTWGRDWTADAVAEGVAAEVEATRRPGATVLLHDSDVTSAPGSWRATVGALPILADAWAAEGLVVGPLAEHGIARTPPRSTLRYSDDQLS